MKITMNILMVLCLMALLCAGGSNMNKMIDWGTPKVELHNNQIILQLSVHNNSNALLILTNTNHLVYEMEDDRLLLSMSLHKQPPLYCGDYFQAKGVKLNPGASYTLHISEIIKMYDNKPFISEEEHQIQYSKAQSMKKALKGLKWFSLRIGYIRCTSKECPIGNVKPSFIAAAHRGFGGPFTLSDVESTRVLWGKLQQD